MKAKLENGALNLTSTARIASHARRKNLTEPEVIALAEHAAHKSTRELDVMLVAQASDPTPQEKVRPLSPRFTELKLTVSRELMELLREAQELEPTPGTSITKALEIALRTHLAHKRKARAKTSTELRLPQSPRRGAESNSRVPRPRSRHIPRATQRSLWDRCLGQCEFIDPETHNRLTA